MILVRFFNYCSRKIKVYKQNRIFKRIGEFGQGSYLDLPVDLYGDPRHIHIGNNSTIFGYFKFISVKGHLYVGNNLIAAQGLTIVTDKLERNFANHPQRIMCRNKDIKNEIVSTY